MPDFQPTFAQAEHVLREHWGYPSFRPAQVPVVEATIAGRDVLAVLPTGGGKSICYQVPALLTDGVTLVISPLIALMQDQVASLQARGIQATFVNSSLTRRQVDQRWTDIEHGRYQLVYMAPERLESDMFLSRAHRLSIDRLAVDEAHCISEWGPNFRPAYLDIARARSAIGNPPTIAVTATATPQVRRDILAHLALRDPVQLVQGFDRPNVIWSVFETENKRVNAKRVVETVPGAGLVYAPTRKQTEDWAAWLVSLGIDAEAYHAGLPNDEREAILNRWLAGGTRIVTATSAFGMGIDKPDVRFVIHAGLSSSVESYYQEAGRAGRDGERSYAVLLVSPGDADLQHDMIKSSHPDRSAIQKVYAAVGNLAQVPLGAEPDGPVPFEPKLVAGVAGMSMSRVRMAVEVLARQGVWELLRPKAHRAMVRFTEPPQSIRAWTAKRSNASLRTFVEGLLRSIHADAFGGWHALDVRHVTRRMKLPAERVHKGLDYLAAQKLLEWRPPGKLVQVVFAGPRVRSVPVDLTNVQRSKRRSLQRLSYLTRYAKSRSCRRRFLLGYFGESHPDRCGACDVCLGRHEALTVTPHDEPALRTILNGVAEGHGRSGWLDSDELPEEVDAHRVDDLIDWLYQEGYLAIEPAAGLQLTEKAHRWRARWKSQDNA